jgi:acetoin utilization deacetylase AcuC-like enzyme
MGCWDGTRCSGQDWWDGDGPGALRDVRPGQYGARGESRGSSEALEVPAGLPDRPAEAGPGKATDMPDGSDTRSPDDRLLLYWDDGYVAPRHVFDTTRKSRDLVALLDRRPQPGVEVVAPSEADVAGAVDAIGRWLDPAYVEALRTGSPPELAESQGFRWDPGIWTMATHSTAGVHAAVARALEVGAAGSLSSGLHHARIGRGAGFCTVNALFTGLVVAQRLLDERQLPLDVLVLDVDAHCGGGTASMLEHHAHVRQRARTIDLSVDAYDFYRADEDRTSLVMWPDDTSDDYLTTLDRLLEGTDWASIGLVLHNAGMDPFPIVGRDELREREQLIARRCREEGVPVAFVLAGGYTVDQTMDELVELHLATVEAMAPLAGRRTRTGHAEQ